MASPVVIVVCPTEVEASHARRIVRDRARVIVSGIGPDRLRASLASVHPFPHAVIVVGVAGGLHPTSIVPRVRSIVDADGAALGAPTWSAPWSGAQTEAILVGVDTPAWTLEDKARLAHASGADIVDCESHALAAWARESGIAWGILRAVSDTSTESVPRIVESWVDTRGRTRLVRIARDLALHPALIPRIRRLGASTDSAMRALGPNLDHLLDMINASSSAAPTTPTLRIGPMPIDASSRRVLVVGGSFDPPHRAHIELSALAARATGCDALLAIPAARSPHKSSGPMASDEDRVAMLELAFHGAPGAAICTLELDRARTDPTAPSYTVDTLATLRESLGASAELRLFMGSDQALSFHRWREPDRILALATPAVVLRPPVASIDALMDGLSPHWNIDQLAQWRSWVVPAPVSPISATAIRGSPEARSADLPDPVARYIRLRGLYASAGP